MWVISSLVLTLLSVGLSEARVRLDPLVQTSQGLIRGQRAEDGDYYMFLGIPYAKVDENNPFGVAQPHPIFDQVFEAYDDSAICLQVEDVTNNVIGSLDCLHLNVHVPTKASSRNSLPVLVWLYGGAFIVGDAGRDSYDPKYLVRHDIIVVTLNYRLGPYGFLCLGIPEVPGNQGLKDQLLALRWIKENIASFGGDVNNITLMGESAGSGSVELHLLSKQERLFNKAILQSGTILKPRGVTDTDVTPALRIAEKLGFITENVSEALAFLVQADPKLVIGASSQLSLNLRPCVEKEFDNIESIIIDHPINLDIPKIRGMPILAGFNSREALMTDSNKQTDYFKSPTYIRDTLQLTFDIDEDFNTYENIIRHYYVGDEELTEEVRPNIIDFESDFYYNYPLQRSLKKYLENGAANVFQYLFSYDGGRNLMKNKLNITLEGVAHADELGYLFDTTFYQKTPSDDDQLIIDRMTTLWANFVEYGDPTPQTTDLLPTKWISITNDTYNYLNIDSELRLMKRPFNDRLAFWELFFTANKEKLKGYNKKISTPQPIFDQIFEANDDSAICPQVEQISNDVIGTLDCLHLNIYVPSNAGSRNRLPVLVWLHGGAFIRGSASRDSYGPKYLVKHEVIVVTLNYRVGPYGFMCLGIPEVPGNQGLKDQLLAFRWIKENIASFGGNANEITLMGESAGGASVELHLFSKQDKFFNKAILQSATTLKPLGIFDTDVTPVLRIAEKLGFGTKNVSEALGFLAQADPKLVIGASSQLSINLRACVEKEIDNIESIITEHPINLDVPKIKGMPILAGFNSREALTPDTNKQIDYLNNTRYFREILQLTFDINDDFNTLESIVRHYYIGDEELTEEMRPNIIDFESDFYYNYPIQWSLKKYLENGAVNVFQYLFTYEGGRNLVKNRLNITLEGAAHADDLGYLFDTTFYQTTPSDDDQLIIDRMTTLWTNFVKYGDPTPQTTELLPEKWISITNDTNSYLKIDSELQLLKTPFNDRLAFWELFFTANKEKLKAYNKT